MAGEQERVVLTAALSIPPDQAWFWTPAWQAQVAEAEADRAAGSTTVYDSMDAFLDALDSELRVPWALQFGAGNTAKV